MPADSDHPERVAIAVPAHVAIAAALGVGALIALLLFVLIGVGRLNGTLRDTNRRLAATDQRVDGIGEDVDPLAKSVPAAFRRLDPRVRGINRDVHAVATDSLPAVQRNTRDIAAAVAPLADEVSRADLPQLTATVDRLARPMIELLTTQPIGETVVATRDLLVLIKRLDLIQSVARGVQVLPELNQTLTDVDLTVHSVRDLTTNVQALLDTSRQTQCLTLRHIQSLDRKTGGELPPNSQQPVAETPPGCRDVSPATR
jgi:uncharacterized protein YoxC